MLKFKYTKKRSDLRVKLDQMLIKRHMSLFDKYGKRGVSALQEATPKDTGLTAASWYYTVVETKTGVNLVFKNSNIVNGVPIAIILQYGHATNGGGYVEGIDYINPSLRPIFEKTASDMWEEMTK